VAEAARWYVTLVLIGLGGVLPAMLLFGGLRSGGVLYARPLALLLVAEIAWLLAALTPLPYGLPLIFAAIATLFGWSTFIAWRRPALLLSLGRERLPLLLAGEAVCVALFALAAFVRSHAPNATDTEKPMDLALIAAVRIAEQMPPVDPWLGGMTVSYYHLGHVMVDVVSRVAALPIGIAFNFGVATAAALAGMAVFALAGDVLALSRLHARASTWIAGAVAVASLLLLAPLEGLFELLAAHGALTPELWQRLGVAGFPGPEFIENGAPTQFWWWWRATRVLPDMITEFPAFSVILGDLHAHLLALPLGVVAVAAVLPSFEGRRALNWNSWRREPGALLLVAALYAGLVMTNSWDALIYGALWAAAVAAVFHGAGWPLHAAVLMTARYLFAPVALALLIAWPFLSSLQSVPLGVGVWAARGSDPVRFALVWMPLVLPLLAGALLLRPGANRNVVIAANAAGCFAVLTWAGALLLRGDVTGLTLRGAGWVTLALLVFLLALGGAAAAAAVRARDTARAAWLGLASAAVAIVLVTELVFLEDAFGTRMNTVFKFWYAVWLMLAVAGAAAIGMAYDRRGAVAMGLRRPGALAAGAACALMLLVYGGALLYAPAATMARSREGQQRAIDALAYLDRTDRGAAGAVRWARDRLGPEDVLLEASGRDYGSGNVVSAASGIPTLLGWAGHEVQWRGSIPALGERSLAISRIYNEGASDEALALARKHGVTYVYIGREEREQFGERVTTLFAAWPTAWEGDGSRIVQVPK
jgi:YYY domain-containing protein